MKKTVVITGASSGIGRACVDRFATDGWTVIMIARREALLKELTDKYPGSLETRWTALRGFRRCQLPLQR